MSDQNMSFFMNAQVDDPEIPDWKSLDIVIRKWAVMSGLEKDLSDYQKRKELYE